MKTLSFKILGTNHYRLLICENGKPVTAIEQKNPLGVQNAKISMFAFVRHYYREIDPREIDTFLFN